MTHLRGHQYLHACGLMWTMTEIANVKPVFPIRLSAAVVATSFRMCCVELVC